MMLPRTQEKRYKVSSIFLVGRLGPEHAEFIPEITRENVDVITRENVDVCDGAATVPLQQQAD